MSAISDFFAETGNVLEQIASGAAGVAGVVEDYNQRRETRQQETYTTQTATTQVQSQSLPIIPTQYLVAGGSALGALVVLRIFKVI